MEDKNIEQEQKLERRQKRINFWIKDITVFSFLLLLVLLLDIYAFLILLHEDSSEMKVRFAFVVLSSTITGCLSYLLGKASQ